MFNKVAGTVKSNPPINKQVGLLTSIAGLGDKTAWAFLTYIEDV